MKTTNPFIAAQCDQAGEVCKLENPPPAPAVRVDMTEICLDLNGNVLVRKADALAALAQKDMEIARLTVALEHIAYAGLSPALEMGCAPESMAHHYESAAFRLVGIAARALAFTPPKE